MLTARTLSDFYDAVIVVDRDVLPEGPRMRKGVPQGSHAHVLLARGGEILEELVPGLFDELDAAGVPKWNDGDLSRRDIRIGVRRLSNDGCMRRPLNDYRPSRPLLDDLVRRRVRAIPNVTILGDHELVELASTEDRTRVTGAVLADRAAGRRTALTADLIVDATGRGSRTPLLLERLGYERPDEDVLTIRLTYTSQWFHIPRGTMPVDMVGAIPEPGGTRGFALLENEGDRWGLSVGTMGRDDSGESCAELFASIEDLAPPDVMDILRAATPIGAVSKYRVPSNRWRRYDKMRRTPDNFLVVGDAFCTFNPIYGQGMTIAALEALILRDCLHRGRRELPRRYFRSAAKQLDKAWQIAVSSDLSLAEVSSTPPLKMRLTNAYLERMLNAAEQDPTLTEQFLRVGGMVDSPARLLRPDMLYRVFRGQRRRSVTTNGRTPVASWTAGDPASG
jgi:2-polyprenyl-6-methoxyphenol hydroxylase-like FAD-dependent oxidoreductase